MAVETVHPEPLHVHGVREVDRLLRLAALRRRGAAVRGGQDRGGGEGDEPRYRSPLPSLRHRDEVRGNLCRLDWKSRTCRARSCWCPVPNEFVNKITRPDWPGNITRPGIARKSRA